MDSSCAPNVKIRINLIFTIQLAVCMPNAEFIYECESLVEQRCESMGCKRLMIGSHNPHLYIQ